MKGKRIDNKIGKTYGTIRGADGKSYFFHKNFLAPGEPMPGSNASVQFESRKDPQKNRLEAFNIIIDKPIVKSFPYTFTKRPGEGDKTLKKNPGRFHDRLNNNCLDLAFEVEWTTITPVAATPCSNPAVKTSFPVNNDGYYQGYNKRWLMFNNRLAISPFTVKSAIANGFAAIMGSCYRVSETEERHGKKDAFCHNDTIPKGQSPCDNLDLLCPRCSLFGMTNKSENKKNEALGFKGRFKASALLNDVVTAEQEYNYTIPHEDKRSVNGSLKQWLQDSNRIAMQVLLPLLAAPKPQRINHNDGYYHDKILKGAKTYLHGHYSLNSFIDFISKEVDRYRSLADVYPKGDKNKEYRHTLRNYTVLCRENLMFKGTIGVENCTPEEAAVLLLLLDHQTANHGFKIGMGKAVGLGTMVSAISKIWFRSAGYKWQSISLAANKLDISTTPALSKIEHELNTLKMTQEVIQRLNCLPSKKKN